MDLSGFAGSLLKYIMCYVIRPDLEGMIADDEMSLEATEDHEVMEMYITRLIFLAIFCFT